MIKYFIFIIWIGIFTGGCFVDTAHAEDFLFTDAEANCAARIIFMNECSGKDANLLYWSPQEAFPSLGIGHFIWYSEGHAEPYLESFPAYLNFAAENGLILPSWLEAIPGRHSPWATREEFQRDISTARMRELHIFLRDTKREQAHFIIQRFMRVFPKILDDLDEAARKPVREKYDLLMMSREATLAMVDYVNFKGEGFRADARYEGVGWGLAQVLMEMEMPDDPANALDEFIVAAVRVLEKRISHSPRPEVETKWLPGWKNRIRGYRSISCRSI